MSSGMSDTSSTAVRPYKPPKDSTALDEVEGHAEHIRSHLPDLNRFLYVSLELITELRAKNIISEEMAQEMHGYECNKLNIKAVGVLTSGVLPYRMFWDQFKQFCQVLWNPIQQRTILKFVIPKKLQKNTEYLNSVFGPAAKIEMIPEDEPVPIQLYIKQPTLQFCSLCDTKLANAAAAKHYTKKCARELVTKLQSLTGWPADIQYKVEMAESGEGATVSVTCPTGQFLDKLMDASEAGHITDHLQEIVHKENLDQNASLDDLKETKVKIEDRAACNTRIAISGSGFKMMTKEHLRDISKVLETTEKEKLLANIKQMKLKPRITEAMSVEEILSVLAKQPDSMFYKLMSSLLTASDTPKYSAILKKEGAIQVKSLERILLKPFVKREWPPKTLDEKYWKIHLERGGAFAMECIPDGLLAVITWTPLCIQTFRQDTGEPTGCSYGGQASGLAYHDKLGVLLVKMTDGSCHHLEPKSLKLIRKVDFGRDTEGNDIIVLSDGNVALGVEIRDNEGEKFAIDIRKANFDMELIQRIRMVGEDVVHYLKEIRPGIVAVSLYKSSGGGSYTPWTDKGLSLYDINAGKHVKYVLEGKDFFGLATDKEGHIWACGNSQVYLISPDMEVLGEYRFYSGATGVAVQSGTLYLNHYDKEKEEGKYYITKFSV